jgi:acetyl-CoA C-acetyltransferase
MRKIAVVGIGQTKVGEHWNSSLRDLAREAGNLALQDAQLTPQALFVGNMSAGRFAGQEHLGALVADALGLRIPATRIEGACASGALAFRKACLAIASGRYDIAMALGVEKMTDLPTDEAVTSLMAAGDQELEASVGLTFSGVFALIANLYMNRYKLSREELALIPVKNHKNGVNNPYAQFNFEVTVDDVIKSPLIADPLRLLDCSPISDGSAAVVLASEEIARKAKNPIWVLASEQANDALALQDREDICTLSSVVKAGKEAYKQAGVTPKDIDLVEAHDCFSIAELIAYEDLGFSEKGFGKALLLNKEVEVSGAIPFNPSGGLKLGHPVGATGVKQIAEVVKQLRGVATNQVRGARIGLTQNLGGSGATAVVNIFSNEVR